jgi:hypothetical protein
MRRRRPTVFSTPPRDGAEPWLALDVALKRRLRATIDSDRLVTEAEIRKFDDEGSACSRMLASALRRGEGRLAELDADSSSSLVEIAATFRDVSALRGDLGELETLLAELHEQARAARSAWLTASARLTSRG